jgi:superfamily II DNA or RNA helicase
LFEPVDIDGMDYRTELSAQVTTNLLKLGACDLVTRELLVQDRHVVLLVEQVLHLQNVHDLFKDIPHAEAYGAVKVEKRRQDRLLFEQDEIKLIIANKVMKKGVSVNRIDAMIDMAEGKSKNDPVQKFGRGLRLHRSKSELIYVDFGTQGHGRFAKASISRRRALQAAGISVTMARVKTEAEAVSALRKFIARVGACHNSKNLP